MPRKGTHLFHKLFGYELTRSVTPFLDHIGALERETLVILATTQPRYRAGRLR